jgi:hypothetical protein
VIASKREGMKAFEPAVVSIASILGFSELEHRFAAFLLWEYQYGHYH